MSKIPLATRKAYLATIPWVTILKTPVACTGWHNKSWGKKPCPNPAYYRFKHHQQRTTARYQCGHHGEVETYCWNHLSSRGLYGDHCEERRTDRWMEKHPPPWPIRLPLCLVMDKGGEGIIYGICNMEIHDGAVHKETLEDGTVWAEWRSVTLHDELTRATEYKTPEQRKTEADG